MAARPQLSLKSSAWKLRPCASLGASVKSLVVLGQPNEALEYIRVAASRFEQLSMLGDAASAHLDTLDLLLRRGDAEAAAAIAKHVVALCRREGADVDAA